MLIKIDYEARTIDIIGEGYPESDPYWISWDRINTPGKLLAWIEHLREKVWWNSKSTHDLIDAFLKFSKIELPMP